MVLWPGPAQSRLVAFRYLGRYCGRSGLTPRRCDLSNGRLVARKGRAPTRRPASPVLPCRQLASPGSSRSLHADRNCYRNTCRGGSVNSGATEKLPGKEGPGSEPNTHAILAFDEAGANGYSDRDEAIPEKSGDFSAL